MWQQLVNFLKNLIQGPQLPPATTVPVAPTMSLDPATFVSLPNYVEAVKRYGAITNGVWPDAAQYCSLLPIPQDIGANWINSLTGQPVVHIYCNNDFHGPLLAALQNVKDRGLLPQLKTFDGAYEVRDVRGIPGRLSWHSYGLAIDILAEWNKLGQPPTISSELVKCFTDVGFVWGGNFSRKDGMHFQWSTG